MKKYNNNNKNYIIRTQNHILKPKCEHAIMPLGSQNQELGDPQELRLFSHRACNIQRRVKMPLCWVHWGRISRYYEETLIQACTGYRMCCDVHAEESLSRIKRRRVLQVSPLPSGLHSKVTTSKRSLIFPGEIASLPLFSHTSLCFHFLSL